MQCLLDQQQSIDVSRIFLGRNNALLASPVCFSCSFLEQSVTAFGTSRATG